MASTAAEAAKTVKAESKKDGAKLDAEAIEEGQVKVKEMVDETVEEAVDELTDQLEDLPPFGLLVPLLTKVAAKLTPGCFKHLKKMADNVVTMPGSALLHLMTIELLTVYLFAYSVGSVLMLIVEAYVRRDIAGEGFWQEGGANEESVQVEFLNEKVETCLKEMARDRVYYMRCHNRYVCFEQGFNVDDAYACDMMSTQVWSLIFYGTVFFCSLLVLDVLVKACLKGVPCMRISGGDYLAFCFQQKRTLLYRYIAGFFLFCAGFTICALFAWAFYEGVFVWAVQTGLAPILIVALSMRAFTLPYKAMFLYTGDDFKKIAFARTFFETSNGFGKRLSTALVQSHRVPKAPLLKKILRASTDADVKKFRSICKVAP